MNNAPKRSYVKEEYAVVESDATIDFMDGVSVLRAKWYANDHVLRVWRPDGEIMELRVLNVGQIEVRGQAN